MFRYILNVFLIFTVFDIRIIAQNLNKVNIPNQGVMIGQELRKGYQKIIGYFSIPYAQPPLNNLRFAPPVTDPLPSWEGERNETFAPACFQVQQDYKDSELPFLQLLTDSKFPNNISFNTNEDCLYLNVFVPTIEGSPPANGFATIIWIHPGNFTTGIPSIWNPHPLVYRKRVIVVTFAWRLNIMGFFTSMDGEAPGNYGLMDQQAAMQWVKNNIKLFNGNPDNISVMGYGTGAISIGIHMVNPGSRGLFSKAILMSGNLFDPSAVRYPNEDKAIIDQLSDDFGCFKKPTSLLLDCLRKVDANLLVERSSNVNWRPLIDKDLSNMTPPFLPELPRRFFDEDDYYKVPILTGYTHMEQALEFVNIDDSSESFSQESLHQVLKDLVNSDIPSTNETDPNCIYNYDHLVDSVMFFYSPSLHTIEKDMFRQIIIDFILEKTYASSTVLLASYLSKDQPTYMYRFDMKPSTRTAVANIPEWATVPHLFDLLYIWGVPYWRSNWDTRDKDISDTIMSLWTNFAKSSNPTENSIYSVDWLSYTKENPGILIINTTFRMSTADSLNYKAFEFWNSYYPKVKDISLKCCGYLSSSTNLYTHKLLLVPMCFNFLFIILGSKSLIN